jgi:uncharacterized membrane protein
MMKLLLSMAISLYFANSAFAVSCHGTEPFWQAELNADSVVFTPAGSAPESQKVDEVTSAVGIAWAFMQVYQNSDGPVAVVKTQECNNGMSDETFPQEVILFKNGDTYYGCCGVGTPTTTN